MFKSILIRNKIQTKRPATWAYFGILMLFGLIVSIGGNGPASEKVFVNSPMVLPC
jgi:hypothetical protein